ncbi:MAG: hypothetical protein DWB56_08105 [Candidatus Jettenia sp.]|uniref:Uncharacterized protein n=1 Tax=Candidatus Jettenia caeni TaxID=247490 RepID=I3IJF8_9BACT|nr:hypothetical protein [Candidatus Jettenia sp. AMX1]MBC6928908.1 hypothetical protein [Candidatus Jettenia sp.]WKZ17123.1 MAG: hypothetical protein QY317_07370 [Candidatus Jettenia caeni]KAA0250850.1 MAG: hypothetical protein EDM77_03315 [Candidatus Jettenia sp. AMX1]MCE7879909.1 hypothetical protein [Candidatus Jettenia sp. AMX1]MCQ3926689.1 hypothetical protein [Candidatus Jettenia sp.]
MYIPEKCGLIPFPPISGRTKTKSLNTSLFLRPFGLCEKDLDVDFAQKVRPQLITQILECCTIDKDGKSPDQGFFLDLTMSKRIECLLNIASSGNSSDMPIYLRCLNKACQQMMETGVSMEEFTHVQQKEDKDYCDIRLGCETLSIRRPTGGDQLEWLRYDFTDKDKAVKTMIRTLIRNEEKTLVNQERNIPDEWVKIIDEAMKEFDPLVNFILSVQCPYCGKEDQHEVDLEEILLRRLRKVQLQLLETVHRLAKHYHWSEYQIFSVPPWRRSYYISLLEKEEDR